MTCHPKTRPDPKLVIILQPNGGEDEKAIQRRAACQNTTGSGDS